jgi:diacylglycerol kinase (ATP)
MKKVIVIYNPFSGRSKVRNLPETIHRLIDRTLFSVEVWPTEKADDVILLTEKAILEKADIVLGAGGDGTINQIASRLVNTGIALGIIPLGSGNGFARHFRIPMNTEDAITCLGKLVPKEIDTVWINRHCMVNIGGIGFDAYISSLFSNVKKRGLMGYLKTIIPNLNYKSEHYRLFEKNKLLWEGRAFMVSVANATQWGNNVVLHAGAEPDDGLLNVVIIRKFGFFGFFRIVKNLLAGKLHRDKKSVTFSGTDFMVHREKDGPVHVDGEPLWLGKEININIEPLSLRILSHG